MRNPLRRSKKIGLTQGGRVTDGVAEEKHSRKFDEQNVWWALSNLPEEQGLVFIIENPSRDYYHPCTEEEIRRTLKLLPRRDSKHLKAVVFKRPSADDVSRGVEARRRYSCVLLNAFPVSNKICWGEKPPSQKIRSHYAPWCDRWECRNGEWFHVWTPTEVRRYYRYHLFLHELGHINQPAFHSLTRREDFAEDYALTWARKLGQLH